MPRVRIKLQGQALETFAKGRAKSGTTRAARKSARDSQRAMRTEAVRQVREKKKLKARAVRKAVVLKKNQGKRLDDMEWGVKIRGDAARVSDYPHRQTKKGVSVEFRPGRRVLLRGAFKATVGTHKGVFERVTDSRLPIREMLAPRALDVLKDRREARAVTRRGREVFQKSFDRLLPIEFGKMKK